MSWIKSGNKVLIEIFLVQKDCLCWTFFSLSSKKLNFSESLEQGNYYLIYWIWSDVRNWSFQSFYQVRSHWAKKVFLPSKM